MKRCSRFSRLGLLTLIFLTLVALFACSSQQAQPEQPPEPVAVDPPLGKAYKAILIDTFKIPADLEKDYREALNKCQHAAIWTLQDKKTYQSVDRYQASNTTPKDALIVKVTVTEMRLVSGAARFWGGALAGSSHMNMNIDFIDAVTNAVVREKDISSSNNALGAAWSHGSSDKSLPDDMGTILGEYINSIIPK